MEIRFSWQKFCQSAVFYSTLIMIFMIMVVVVHISALNDTTVLAERLVTGLAWKLGTWWKKLV